MSTHPIHRALILTTLFWTAGCAEPTLDAQDLEGSAAKLRRTLDEAQQREFDGALELIQLVREGSVPGTTSVAVDGMGASQLIAEAERIELRREIATLEATLAAHEEVLSESDRLTQLSIAKLGLITPDDELPSVTAEVENGTGKALSSAFVRLRVLGARKLVYKTEEYVPFQPQLDPAEVREIEIRVSRDFGRIALSTPEARLAGEFTSFEGDGEVLAQEPDREQLDRATKAVSEGREKLDELRRKLAAV